MPTLARSHIFSSIPKQGPELSEEEAIMDAIVLFQKRSGANALPLESFQFSALAPPSATGTRQAEDVQLHVCRTTVEKLEEAIEKGVLVVCDFHEAYLRFQLDYAD